MIMQSCVVYQHTPLGLEQSHDQGKGKLIRDFGYELKFKNITLTDGIYTVHYRKYVKNAKEGYKMGNYSEPITSEQVSVIYLKDGKKSGLRTAGLIFGVSVGIAAVTIGIIIAITIKNM